MYVAQVISMFVAFNGMKIIKRTPVLKMYNSMTQINWTSSKTMSALFYIHKPIIRSLIQLGILRISKACKGFPLDYKWKHFYNCVRNKYMQMSEKFAVYFFAYSIRNSDFFFFFAVSSHLF